jgi:pimeloyl-ACP methyl ester carboxylesterase
MHIITDPETAASRYLISRDNLRLHYLDIGPRNSSATTVLCLPGLTRNGRDFFPLASRLAPERRVIILDGRGRGRSEYATERKQYKAEVDLDDIMQTLVAADIRRTVIIGTSFGGLMALGLAAFRPTVVAGVVLNDIGPVVGWSAVDNLLKAFSGERALSNWDEAVSELKRIIPELGLTTEEAWLHAAKATWREGPDGRLHMDFDARLGSVWRSRGVGEHDLWSLWQAVLPIPTLALRGGISKVLTEETLGRMQETKPDLHIARIPNVGHAPSLIEPEAEAAISGLLAEVDAREYPYERRSA